METLVEMAVAAGRRRTARRLGPVEGHGQTWGNRSVYGRDEMIAIFEVLQKQTSVTRAAIARCDLPPGREGRVARTLVGTGE